MRASMLIPIALLAFLFIPIPKAMSATPTQLAAVSGTLDPTNQPTKDFMYTLPRDLEDFLLHVTVTASNPQTDTLDITPNAAIPDGTWTDLQGEFWDYWEDCYFCEPLSAGGHTLTAAIGPNATSQISFEVQFLEVPTPPVTFRGSFPANPYTIPASIRVNLPKGNCSIAADVSSGSIGLTPEGLDIIQVSGPVNTTLHFPDAGVYAFTIEPDPTQPTAWSITFGEAVIPEFLPTASALVLPLLLAVTVVLVRRRRQ